MDRRQFAARSLAALAGTALSPSRGHAATRHAATQSPLVSNPGSIPDALIKKAHFPDGFLWGVATASYPNEGAWNIDGKG